MPYLFEIVLATEAYYLHPSSKDGLYYAYDPKRQKIFMIHAYDTPKERRIERKAFSVSDERKESLEKILEEAGPSFEKEFADYEIREGASFSHGLFLYKGMARRFPDYLANFHAADIFYRYRYYPDEERVAFYTTIRKIYRWLFDIVGDPSPIPFYEHPIGPMSMVCERQLLELEDFGIVPSSGHLYK